MNAISSWLGHWTKLFLSMCREERSWIEVDAQIKKKQW